MNALPTSPARTLRRIAAALLATLLLGAAPPQALAQRLPQPDPDDGAHFRVLAFHDVRDDVRGSFTFDPEESAISTRTLVSLFAWLRDTGWRPVSLQQIDAARQGTARLPPRAVLPTFDDGYKSAYTKVYPLLRSFGYPAVMALVTSWLDTPAGSPVPYGTATIDRGHFLDWNEVREMAGSGLVEFASHSDALHRGVPANPQGNLLPAAAVHAYDRSAGRYETDAAYAGRIEADLRRSRERIEQETGAPARAIVWPYGAYNHLAVEAARRAGLPWTMTLEDGPNDARTPAGTQQMRRALATYDLEAAAYGDLLRRRAGQDPRDAERAMQVDLDYVYDPDPAQQEANLSKLLDRVLAISPSSVWLQAYADPDGDGVADAVYFPNRTLPVRADLFNRVAWQLRTRAGVRVFAWMPVLGWKLPPGHAAAQQLVTATQAVPAGERYQRLSPFDDSAKQAIAELYEDLGRHAMFAGVVFHDDALLGDDEDASPAALAVYRSWGLPGDIAAIRADPALMGRWTRGKTRALNDLTLTLAQRLRAWQPGLLTARNVYAGPLLDANAEQWFSQHYETSLADYDFTAVMAMPAMEKQADGDRWLAALADRAARTPLGLQRTVFELQARDWRSGKAIPDATLARQWAVLRRHGARNLAYYPDDFLNDQPSLATVRQALSVRPLPLPGGAPPPSSTARLPATASASTSTSPRTDVK